MTLFFGSLTVLTLAALAYFGWLGVRLRARLARSRLLVNSSYEDLLSACNLNEVADFLALGSVIVSGHLDRNVWSVQLDDGSEVVNAYLKREHFVSWTTRFLNALNGFGFVSRSWREVRTLQALARTRIRCPEWLAAGEDAQGRAFLLLREVTDAVELREAIAQSAEPEAPPARAAARARDRPPTRRRLLASGPLCSPSVDRRQGRALFS